ncbi:MAG: hypothetical protein VKQ33_10605 [Candidatus Sericytochromatia bacterium]|nr:hypothetical protein [Candidatus Sericytochromatia bacterium]
MRTLRFNSVLLGCLALLTGGCLAAAPPQAPASRAAQDVALVQTFKGAPLPYRLAQASDPGIQLWGAHIKLNAAPTAPQITQGFRLRRYQGWPATPEQVLAGTPYMDRTISGYPIEFSNANAGNTATHGSYTFGDGTMLWDMGSQTSPSISSLQSSQDPAGNTYMGGTATGCGQRLSGYVQIPQDGDYTFAFYDHYAWYHNDSRSGSLADPTRVLTYFRIGSNVFKESDVTHFSYAGYLAQNNTPVRLKAGLYPYDYLSHYLYAHFTMAVVYKDSPTATTWKRFPTSAWQVAVDGTNPTINTGGQAEPGFSGIGAADFSTVSYTSAATYESGFDARWRGKMARVTYTVPAGKYLVVQSVTARDLVNDPTRRASLTPFVQLDNLSVSAPVDQNGLQGVKLFGPGTVLSLAAPVLASAATGEYVPEILVSGLLLSEDAFSKGSGWIGAGK